MELRDRLQSSLGTAYTLDRELGGGGMSRVFLAEEGRLGRKVVVKVLSPELAADISAERFEREIKLAASLQQANIVPVLTAGDAGGVPYYTMPYVEGESLRALLAKGGALSVSETAGILRDVAHALSYAHARGIVHRDIKPDNILLSHGTAVVTDFGIAKAISAARTGTGATLTQADAPIGTPAYMAPEQVAGDPSIDHRADIYAFGCVAYELLTGSQPFAAARSRQRLLAAHLSEAPREIADLRRDLPPTLGQLVMRCLAKHREDRPQTASEIIRLLQALTGANAIAIPTDGFGSLRSVLLVWALGAASSYVLARAAVVGIGLPDWVVPGVVWLAGAALVGVLVVHAIHGFARRAGRRNPTITPGGSSAGASTLATIALHAAPVLTWRRTSRVFAGAGAAFVALVAVFMAMRVFGIGPAATLFSKGLLKQHDRIIIAQMAGDTALSNAFTDAFRGEFADSKVVTVLGLSAIAEGLARMERPATTPLDPSLARELAQREGAKLVVTGNVSTLGLGFLLSAQLLDPVTGHPVAATFRETARDNDDLLPAIGRLTKHVRAKIGESLRTLQNLPPVEQVTTGSLDAFRKYVQAVARDEGGLNPDIALSAQLLREAVALDSTFAMAYRKLAWDVDPDSAARWATLAYRYRNRLSEVERLQAEGTYYWFVKHDADSAIYAHVRAYQIDSTIPRLALNLSILFLRNGDSAQALKIVLRASEQDSVILAQAGVTPAIAMQRQDVVDRALRIGRGGGEQNEHYVTSRMWELSAQRQFDSVALLVPSMPRRLAGPLSLYLNAIRGELRRLERSAFALNDSRALSPLASTFIIVFAAQTRAWLLNDTSKAGAILDSVAHAMPKEVRSAPHVKLAMANAYAVARRPRDARSWLEALNNGSIDSVVRRGLAAEVNDALGWILLAEGKRGDARVQFESAAQSAFLCRPCERAAIGYAYDLDSLSDSTRVIYDAILDSPNPAFIFDAGYARWLPKMLKRSGEFAEQAGDTSKARTRYAEFVSLWKDADSALQPQVRAARAKLDHLNVAERGAANVKRR